ncbi:MAG: ATP-binding protein [Rhizobiaceae bacterium]|nr:ATP-binding protein [Rhizobiaceae bacterium]
MANNVVSAELVEALSRVRQSMPAAELELADRMAEISSKHVETMRDRAFDSRFRRMKRSLVAHFTGDNKQHRIIIVTGESHAGKTALIEHRLDSDPGFFPYVDKDGNMTVPILKMEAPSPCNLVNLAIEGLTRLGYPVKGDIKEKTAWPLFRDQLKRFKVLVVFIDEAQHTVNSTNRADLQRLRDIFKHLVQMKDWPVRLILAGVSPLEKLREDRQIRTRSMPLHLGDLSVGAHSNHVRHWVRKIVTEHAELRLGDFLAGDFPDRMIHSAGGCFGSIIQLTRLAVEDALVNGEGVVGDKNFAAAYSNLTGCSSSQNIFTARKWRMLEGALAKIADDSDANEGGSEREIADDGDEGASEGEIKPKVLKRHRGGER